MKSKKGFTMSVTLIVALIIGSLLLMLYFTAVFPKIQSFGNRMTLIGSGCKYPGFYYDIISHNREYSYQFYQEYLDCNYKEDDEDAYMRAYRDLGLKPYGIMNLIKGYVNTGNAGALIIPTDNSFLDRLRRNNYPAYMERKLSDLSKRLDNLPDWSVVANINVDIEGTDIGSCDEVVEEFDSNDYETFYLIGHTKSRVLPMKKQCSNGDWYDILKIDKVRDITFTEGSVEVSISDKGESAETDNYKFTFVDTVGKNIKFKLELT